MVTPVRCGTDGHHAFRVPAPVSLLHRMGPGCFLFISSISCESLQLGFSHFYRKLKGSKERLRDSLPVIDRDRKLELLDEVGLIDRLECLLCIVTYLLFTVCSYRHIAMFTVYWPA